MNQSWYCFRVDPSLVAIWGWFLTNFLLGVLVAPTKRVEISVISTIVIWTATVMDALYYHGQPPFSKSSMPILQTFCCFTSKDLRGTYTFVTLDIFWRFMLSIGLDNFEHTTYNDTSETWKEVQTAFFLPCPSMTVKAGVPWKYIVTLGVILSIRQQRKQYKLNLI